MSRGPGIAGEILARYRTSISKGLLPHKVLQVLASAGVVIQPYHFYREQAAPRPPHLRDSGSAGPEFAEAGPGDAVAIAALDPKTDGRAQIANDFSKGRRCFVLRMEGEIIAATWCDTAELDFNPCRRPLGDDEAYLYGMQTLHRHRGHDIAPRLRWKCLEFLAASGRRSCYSYSDYFNRPAIRFKEKIGARKLFTGMYVGIRGLGGKNFILRRYDRGPE